MLAPLDVITWVVCTLDMTIRESGVASGKTLSGPLEDLCSRLEESIHGSLGNPDVVDGVDGVEGSLLEDQVVEVE